MYKLPRFGLPDKLCMSSEKASALWPAYSAGDRFILTANGMCEKTQFLSSRWHMTASSSIGGYFGPLKDFLTCKTSLKALLDPPTERPCFR